MSSHAHSSKEAPDFLSSSLQLPRQGSTLCFLVVADMDLPSASGLAESALRELPDGGTLVDGIIACGPFLGPNSLLPYLHNSSLNIESPELTFAAEGLVTGCLSQLESIVCRVAWLPSPKIDPSTLRGKEEKRLTPNSRNIHRQYLPLAPGLSICGVASDQEDSVEAASIISKLLKLATATPTTKEYPVTASIVVGSGVETRNDTTILHIFAGAPQRLEGTVLYPGSLKDRGDYCLVYLHVVEGEEETFRWQVKNVDFRQMEHGGGGR